MKPRNCVVLVLLLLEAAWQPWAQAPSQNAAGSQMPAQPASPTAYDLDRGITLATDYMVRSCFQDGHFVYRVDPVSGQGSQAYNVVRHAGAMYALGMAYEAHPSRPVADTLIRAAAYLQERYVAPVPGTDELAVWSQPKPQNELAQLGASGLGLVALIAARKAGAASVTVPELEAIGRFILSLQRPDGRFVSRYDRDKGPIGSWESLYYPGEAALGLVRLYQVDGSTQWLEAAAKALAYLAMMRSASDRVPPDHWSLIATAELLPLYAQGHITIPRDRLLHHAIQIVNELLQEQHPQLGDPQIDGAFDSQGRTAPTSTSVEGLLAALSFLPPSRPIRATLLPSAARGITFLLRSQTPSGTYAGALPNTLSGDSTEARSLRIDFVQHALSAYLRYRDAMTTY